MTIRKIWLLALMCIVIISIGINTLVLTTLTDRYFKTYLAEEYETKVQEIKDYIQQSYSKQDESLKLMKIKLETYLDDPIIKLQMIDSEGDILVGIENQDPYLNIRNHGQMMTGMMSSGQEEMDQWDIMTQEGEQVYLIVTRLGSTENSAIARLFKSRLMMNSLFSIIIVLTLSIMIGIYISKKMSKALIETANMADDLKLGIAANYKRSGIIEITKIRDSLEDLDIRLRLKQKSRKRVLDQLIHETRTPLTILRSHFEAIQDGVMEISLEEIQVWQNQIDSVTTLVTNLGSMIDAEKSTDQIRVTTFDIHMMLSQILNGLKTQFDQKQIHLTLDSNETIMVNTDQHKLSQSIYSILTNAFKYTNQHGTVKMGYEVREDQLLISIKDTGVGIHDEDKDKIFEAYYRGGTPYRTKGEGLGLFLAKENLNEIGGSIEVDSKLGLGSAFNIRIPRDYNEFLER